MSVGKKAFFDPDKSYMYKRRILSTPQKVVFSLDYDNDKSFNVTLTISTPYTGARTGF